MYKINNMRFKPITKTSQTDVNVNISSTEHYLISERHKNLRVDLVNELSYLQIEKNNIDALYYIALN